LRERPAIPATWVNLPGHHRDQSVRWLHGGFVWLVLNTARCACRDSFARISACRASLACCDPPSARAAVSPWCRGLPMARWSD